MPEAEERVDVKGVLLKRKDFLDVDEKAGSHPNRTYYFRRVHDLDSVIETCTKKLLTDSSNFKALYIRGTSLFKKGKLNAAINDLTHALRIQPNNLECLYYRGMAYSKAEMHDAALSDLSYVLKLHPDHVNAAFARAALYNKMGLFPQAIEDYNFALSKDQPSTSPKNDDTLDTRSRNWSADSLFSSSVGGRATPGRSVMTMASSSTAAPTVEPFSPAGSVVEGRRVKRIDASGLFSLYSNSSHVNAHTPMDTMSTTSATLVQDDQSSTLDSVIDNSTRRADDLHAQGYACRKRGDFQGAIAFYTQALEIDPRHFKSLFNRGFARDKQQEYALALSDYNQAIEVQPKHAFAYYNRGITHDHLNNLNAAIEDFSRALSLNPENLDFLYNRACCQRKKEDYRSAAQDFEKMINVLRSSAQVPGGNEEKALCRALHNRAYCLGRAKAFAPALQDINALLELTPGHPPAVALRAQLWEQTGSLQLALADFTMLVSQGQALGAALIGRAKVLSQMGQYASAIADLSQALDLQAASTSSSASVSTAIAMGSGGPNTAQLYFSRGMCHKSMGAFDLAVRDFSRALQGYSPSPSSPTTFSFLGPEEDLQQSLYHHRGHCLRKIDDLPAALQDYTQLLQLLISAPAAPSLSTPSHKQACVRAYNNRAFVYARMNNPAAAVQDYTQALTIDPGNSHAYHNRGILYDKMGLIDQAIGDFGKVFELDNAQAFDPLQGQRPGQTKAPPSAGSGASGANVSGGGAGGAVRVRPSVSFDSAGPSSSPLKLSDLTPDPLLAFSAPSSASSQVGLSPRPILSTVRPAISVGVVRTESPAVAATVPPQIADNSARSATPTGLRRPVVSAFLPPPPTAPAGLIPPTAPPPILAPVSVAPASFTTNPYSLPSSAPSHNPYLMPSPVAAPSSPLSDSGTTAYRAPVPVPIQAFAPSPASASSAPMHATNYLASLGPTKSGPVPLRVPQGIDIVPPGRFSTR